MQNYPKSLRIMPEFPAPQILRLNRDGRDSRWESRLGADRFNGLTFRNWGSISRKNVPWYLLWKSDDKFPLNRLENNFLKL